MHCSAIVCVDEFSIFSTFSVVLLVLGRPEHLSSSTDTRPALKCECHSKLLSFSKNLTTYFKGFGSGFTELHTKLDADTLLDFASHRRQNETRSREITRVKQCVFTAWCHMAD
jgi:hypothetical protein